MQNKQNWNIPFLKQSKSATVERLTSSLINFLIATRSYNDMDSINISKLAHNVRLQMKVHFPDLRSLISIIEFMAKFSIPWNRNDIRKGEAMWVLLHYGKQTPAHAINGRMHAKYWSSPLASFMRRDESRSWRLLHSSSKDEKYLLKKYSTD